MYRYTRYCYKMLAMMSIFSLVISLSTASSIFGANCDNKKAIIGRTREEPMQTNTSCVHMSFENSRHILYLESGSYPELKSITATRTVIMYPVGNGTFLNFTSLQNITSGLTIGANSGLQHLSIDSLQIIPGHFQVVSNSELEEIHLPQLTSVGKNIVIHDNYNLSKLSLPRLTSVGGDFEAFRHTMMLELKLPRLTSIGGYFHVYENDALRTVECPSLTSVGGYMSLYGNDKLKNTDFLSLTSIRKHLTVSHISDPTAFPKLTKVYELSVYNHMPCFLVFCRLEDNLWLTFEKRLNRPKKILLPLYKGHLHTYGEEHIHATLQLYAPHYNKTDGLPKNFKMTTEMNSHTEKLMREYCPPTPINMTSTGATNATTSIYETSTV